MYDSLETDLSFKYLQKIERIESAVIVGGWAIYYYINETYKKAFGVDYLKSRDIDVFVKKRYLENFLKLIENMGFVSGSYFFRYELIYSRSKEKIIDRKESRKYPVHDLIYVFLDLFTEVESKKAWFIDILKKAKFIKIEGIKVIDFNSLLKLKCLSFFEREKLDKELKDACDIYSLLVYSGRKIIAHENIKKVAEKIINRRDLGEYIAENVLKDITKINIVYNSLKKFL